MRCQAASRRDIQDETRQDETLKTRHSRRDSSRRDTQDETRQDETLKTRHSRRDTQDETLTLLLELPDLVVDVVMGTAVGCVPLRATSSWHVSAPEVDHKGGCWRLCCADVKE